jgi:hypothetical protein
MFPEHGWWGKNTFAPPLLCVHVCVGGGVERRGGEGRPMHAPLYAYAERHTIAERTDVHGVRRQPSLGRQRTAVLPVGKVPWQYCRPSPIAKLSGACP